MDLSVVGLMPHQLQHWDWVTIQSGDGISSSGTVT